MRKVIQGMLLVILFSLVFVSHGHTQQAKPPTTTSWYVRYLPGDTNQILATWMYNKGYEAGQRDLNLPGTQYSFVILHLGQPMIQGSTYGTSGYGRFLSTSTIIDVVKQFAIGYYYGTGSDTQSRLRIVLGTSNSGSYVTYAHGQVWASTTQNIGVWLQSTAFGSQVEVRGGSDIEIGWSAPPVAISWVNGYTSTWVQPYSLYHFGDAQGCPTSGTTNVARACDLGWDQDTIRFLAWGAPPSVPFPQIYSTAGGNARQWQQLSLYSYLAYGGRMTLYGPLSQYAACIQNGGCSGTNNTSDQAWSQLWSRLNEDSRTAQNLSYSTDIKWR